VSLGRTIAESLATCDGVTKRDLGAYCQRHKSSRLSEETLATVFALQDGVSRLPQGYGRSRGGVGMMDMVQFMNELSGTPPVKLSPRLVIISGHACVTFRDSYRMGAPERAVRQGTSARRVQWFNVQNDVGHPPDAEYAFALPRRFPGTLISLRFCLGHAALEGAGRESDEDRHE
jgi:hypothetical protein